MTTCPHYFRAVEEADGARVWQCVTCQAQRRIPFWNAAH